MENALSTSSSLIDYAARAIDHFNKPGHADYYPYPLWQAAHAARISLLFRSKVRTNDAGGRLSWAADLGGFLIMCWSGSILISLLFGNVPIQAISAEPWLAYASVHILISSLSILVPSTDIKVFGVDLLDLIWPVLDAVTKSGAIIGAVQTVQKHPNPAVSNSLFAQMLVGAFAPVGGSLIGGMLNVQDANWHLSTPALLKSGNGLLSTLDVWSGVMSAAIFGALTAVHPTYQPFYTVLGANPKGIMTAQGARSIIVVLLTALYSARAIFTAGRSALAPTIRANGQIVRNGRAMPSGKAH